MIYFSCCENLPKWEKQIEEEQEVKRREEKRKENEKEEENEEKDEKEGTLSSFSSFSSLPSLPPLFYQHRASFLYFENFLAVNEFALRKIIFDLGEEIEV